MAYTTINKSSDYFDTKIYTQTGSNNNGDTQTITMDNVGFTWFKNRDYINAHALFDIVRGGDKLLATNGTGAEETVGGGITFGASDTTIGADTGGYGFNNRVGDDYVAWHWRTDGTSGSSNTDGSITSTVSASTTSGFSIVSFNGQTGTVGHGLGVKPSMIILKCRAVSNNWVIQHKGLTGGMDENVLIFTTSAEISAPTAEPTTSVFTVNNQIAENNDNIAYVFAEKKGFSKFGSYTGNGSTDGSFIFTGFKPAFVIIKGSSNTENWHMYDNKRDTFNPTDQALQPNTTSAEFTETNVLDFLSNGFKLRVSGGGHNGSGVSYIYMAFAEAPLVGNNNVPCTAR